MSSLPVAYEGDSVAHLQEEVERLASGYLESLYGTEEGRAGVARLTLGFIQAARRDPKLIDCSRESWAKGIAFAAFTGLTTVGVAHPELYLFPRGNELQVEVAPHGWHRLYEMAGYRVAIRIVYEGDSFDIVDVGPHYRFDYKPSVDAEAGFEAMRCAFIRIYKLDTGELAGSTWLRKKQIEQRRNASDSWRKSGPKSVWGKWPDEMIEKTLLKHAVSRRVVPADSHFAAAVDMDVIADRILDIAPARRVAGPGVASAPLQLPAGDIGAPDFQKQADDLNRRQPAQREEPAKQEPAAEPPKVDTAAVKRECDELVAKLPESTARAILESFGVNPDHLVKTWRGRPEKTARLRARLQQAVSDIAEAERAMDEPVGATDDSDESAPVELDADAIAAQIAFLEKRFATTAYSLAARYFETETKTEVPDEVSNHDELFVVWARHLVREVMV